VPSQESGLLTSYSPPKSATRLIKKIFDATGLHLEEAKLNRTHKNCLDKLAINLSNSRFVKIINNYSSKEDRNLFEEEFVRLTWDKPDLTADELNLYMNACKEIINLEVISKHLNKLNNLFDEAEDQNEMTVKLAEIIKAKSGEYHQCEGRIEALTKKLQGDRAERMKHKQRENASILSLVQMFQEEEERKNMIRIADMQKQLVKQEAQRLEGMAAFKARVLGISQEDVI
jgi:monoamine oxidase